MDKIGIIDADFMNRRCHRFPNLACMKISSYEKSNGNDVELINGMYLPEDYDRIYVSKVFSDTDVSNIDLDSTNTYIGGTGFDYVKSSKLPEEIEHIKPDYDLYEDFVDNSNKYKYFNDYSIGFTTRGCFRHCGFCVNKESSCSARASRVEEFIDDSKKKICLLDDNVLACSEWESIFNELNETGKKFQYKQGLDERLLDDRKCDVIFSSNYDGEYIFAFDNVEDKRLIAEKLEIARKYSDKTFKFYVLCGYDRRGKYDELFWENDIASVFERIETLNAYGCIPYIMRYKMYEKSPYRGMYVNLARWCNQPSLFKKMSFYDFVSHKDNIDGSAYRYFTDFMRDQSYIQENWLTMRWNEI